MDYKLSIYQPAEVEIGGQKYPLKKRNRTMFRAIAEYEKKLKDASDFEKIEVLYDELRALIDAPAEVLDALDQDELVELKTILEAEVFKSRAPAIVDDPEKNGPKPGEEVTPA